MKNRSFSIHVTTLPSFISKLKYSSLPENHSISSVEKYNGPKRVFLKRKKNGKKKIFNTTD